MKAAAGLWTVSQMEGFFYSPFSQSPTTSSLGKSLDSWNPEKSRVLSLSLSVSIKKDFRQILTSVPLNRLLYATVDTMNSPHHQKFPQVPSMSRESKGKHTTNRTTPFFRFWAAFGTVIFCMKSIVLF